MPANATQLQLIALPKGVDGGARLRVTLCLRPAAQDCGFNLPAYVRGIDHFELEVGSASLTVLGRARVPIDATQRSLLDPALWDRLLKDAKPCGDSGSNPPAMLAVATARMAKMLDVMRTEMREDPSESAPSEQIASGLFRAAAGQGGPQEEPRVASLRPGWRRKGAHGGRPAGRTIFAASVAGIAAMPQVNALDDAEIGLRGIYSVAGGALKSAASALQKIDASQAQEKLLLAQFKDTRCLALLQAYEPAGDASETLRRLGLRVDAATAAIVAGRWKAMTSHKPPTVDAPLSFRDLWIDCLLATAPLRPQAALAKSARTLAGASAAQAVDSYENRLAAIIQELPLHPVFGLAVDLVFELPPDLLRAIAQGAACVRVRPVEGTALLEQHWTAIGSDGWPRPKNLSRQVVASENPRAAVPDVFTADGWMSLPPERAYLSNVPVLEGIEKVAHAVLQRMNARATGVAKDAGPPPNLRSGPVVLHLDGDAHGKRGQALAQAGEDPFPELLHLEELVQGVRPVIRFRDESGNVVASPLLRRSVSYRDVGAASMDLARALEGGGATREEGQVSRLRAALLADGSTERLNEQVFEWGDWNPAVPFPSTAIDNDPRDVLPKTLRALPDGNPPYRFGLDVDVACRWVLLDGSSRISADQIENANAPWFPGGQGFRIRRQEPLQKPLVLMRDDPPGTPLLEDETTTEVVLASQLDGPAFREASVRYVLAGPMKDVVSVIRHGMFDDGVSPRSSAYADIERAAGTEESLFPTVTHGKTEMPVFRRLAGPAHIADARLIRPDPLVSGLRFILARRGPLGEWLPLMDRGVSPARALQTDVALYPHRRWPDAVVVRVLVEATDRERNADPLVVEHDAKEMRLRVRVPAGEQFSVLVVPFAHPDAKSCLHAMHDRTDLDPALADMQVIGVSHFVDRPLAPAIAHFSLMERARLERSAALSLMASVDPGSTASLDLFADWREPLDDPAMPRPIDVSDRDAPARSQLVGQLTSHVQPAIDRLAHDPMFCVVGRPPIQLSAPSGGEIPLVHDLPDTKYRVVSYRLQSLARSSASLANVLGAQARRSTDSVPVVIPVLASAPPLAPQVREVQLAFRFERRMQQLTSTSDRHCALSVVMERGWWSSGPGELLGVVIRPMPVPGRRHDARSLWAEDPMRPSATAYPVTLDRQGFLPTQQSREGAGFPEGLVLYEPRFDASCVAWRVDIALRLTDVHLQPFVQLVLVRWQKNAIEGASTSPPVVVDFYQLPSRRSATVSYLPESGKVEIMVCGPVDPESCLKDPPACLGFAPGRAVLEAQVQYTEGAGYGADVWMDYGEPHLLIAHPTATGGGWHGKFPVAPEARRQKLRVALFERMKFGATLGPPNYLDAVPLHLMNDVPRGDSDGDHQG